MPGLLARDLLLRRMLGVIKVWQLRLEHDDWSLVLCMKYIELLIIERCKSQDPALNKHYRGSSTDDNGLCLAPFLRQTEHQYATVEVSLKLLAQKTSSCFCCDCTT